MNKKDEKDIRIYNNIDSESSASLFEDTWLNFAIVGRCNISNLKAILNFVEAHGRIFYRKASGSNTRLYITNVKPCEEVDGIADGDEP